MSNKDILTNDSAKSLAELYIKTGDDRNWFLKELNGSLGYDVYEVARILAEGLNQK